MTFSDIVLIIATLLAPVLAVQTQKWIERTREAKQKREQVFRVLMATRATKLSPQHVEALNLIDIEFYPEKFKTVKEAWKEYSSHLNVNDEKLFTNDSRYEVWLDKRESLFNKLMYEMGKSIGYGFDMTHIKSASYYPKGLGEIDNDSHLLRKYLLELLEGKRNLPMNVISFPDMEDTDTQKKINEIIINKLEEGDSENLIK